MPHGVRGNTWTAADQDLYDTEYAGTHPARAPEPAAVVSIGEAGQLAGLMVWIVLTATANALLEALRGRGTS